MGSALADCSTSTPSVLDEAVGRVLSSKSVPEKERKSKVFPRKSDGDQSKSFRKPSPSDDDEESCPGNEAKLGRANSDHRGGIAHKPVVCVFASGLDTKKQHDFAPSVPQAESASLANTSSSKAEVLGQ